MKRIALLTLILTACAKDRAAPLSVQLEREPGYRCSVPRFVFGAPEHLDLEIFQNGVAKRVRYVSEFEISRRLSPGGFAVTLSILRERLEGELTRKWGPRRNWPADALAGKLVHWLERLIMPSDGDDDRPAVPAPNGLELLLAAFEAQNEISRLRRPRPRSPRTKRGWLQ